MMGKPFVFDICSDAYREKCRYKLIEVLAKAQVRGEISNIDSIFIKEAFEKGYKTAGKFLMSKKEQIEEP